ALCADTRPAPAATGRRPRRLRRHGRGRVGRAAQPGRRAEVDVSGPRIVMDVRTLADGNQIPLLGLGVWQVPDGPECVNAVRWALELGYRHIDTAQAYGNEQSVGQALRESGVPREEVFITTKFYPRRRADPAAEAERSLRRLGAH